MYNLLFCVAKTWVFSFHELGNAKYHIRMLLNYVYDFKYGIL